MISEPPCKCVQNCIWLSSRSKCLILTVIPTRRRTKCLSENLESAGGEQVRLLDHHRNRDYDPQSLKRSYLDFGGWVCGVFEYKAQQRSTSPLLTVLRMPYAGHTAEVRSACNETCIEWYCMLLHGIKYTKNTENW